MTQDDRAARQSNLFMELVASFQLSSLQCLGKLVDPRTGKAEVDLQGAAAAIDRLDMLAAKTKGNLTPDEAILLNNAISNLKLNYVEEASKPKEASPPESAEEVQGQGRPAEPPPPEEHGQGES